MQSRSSRLSVPAVSVLFKSQFGRAVAMLAAGQGLAALIPIVAAPILGRLYHPADYGALATYMAVGTLLGSASALQMPNAVVAEKSDRDAVALVSVCLAAALAMSGLAVLAGAGLFAAYRNDPAWAGLAGWFLLLPVTTMGAGVTAAIAALANRRSRYGFMARVQIMTVATATALSIVLGFFGAGAQGLFVAYFAQQALAVVAHLVLLREFAGFRLERRPDRLAALFRRHRRFALFTLPSEFVGSFNQSLPVFALSWIGQTSTLGAYNRARQLVMLPFNLLGTSISQVFRQRAAGQYHATGSCRPLFARTFLALLLMGAPPLAILMAIAPQLFRIVLGPNWTEAGEIARIIAPMLLARLLVSPLTSVFHFTQTQILDLVLNIAGALVMTVAVAAAVWSGCDSHATVAVYTAANVLIYAAYLVAGWRLAKRRDAAGSGGSTTTGTQ